MRRSGCSRPSRAGRSQRFVYASSSSVYGDVAAIPMREDAAPQPLSPYGVTKLAAEHLCHLYHVNYGVPTVSLRYFTVYGPRQRPDMGFHRFIRAALTRPAHHALRRRRADTRLHVRGRRRRGRPGGGRPGRPGGVYNIGGGSRVSVNQVLDLIGRLTGRPLDIRREAAQKGDMRDTWPTRRRPNRQRQPHSHSAARPLSSSYELGHSPILVGLRRIGPCVAHVALLGRLDADRASGRSAGRSSRAPD